MMAAAPGARRSPVDLIHWADDDHELALSVYLKTVPDGWPRPAADQSARAFFETAFSLSETVSGLCTAYFEPELNGALTRSGPYQHPIYKRPPDLRDGVAYHDRAEIDAGALAGQGLELAWLDDPVEAFFLQIQGSGRIALPDGSVMRVGYAGKNGRPYRSVGALLVERGIMALADVTAERVKDWLRRQPDAGRAIMAENPSYVFFEPRPVLRDADGPIGTANTPLTAFRSIAVDQTHWPLGALLWVSTPSTPEMDGRLTVAQDTGGAIKGVGRADLYFGTGARAGARAGEVRGPISMTALTPNTRTAL